MLYGGTADRTIPAGSGRRQVLRLVRDLMADEPPERAPLTDLSPMLCGGRRRASSGARSCSSCPTSSATPGWDRPLNLLIRRHEVIAVRLHDPREAALPDAGPLVLQDAETGEQLLRGHG